MMGCRICSFAHLDGFCIVEVDAGTGAGDAHMAVEVKERRMERRGRRNERDFIVVGNGLLSRKENLWGRGFVCGRLESRGR